MCEFMQYYCTVDQFNSRAESKHAIPPGSDLCELSHLVVVKNLMSFCFLTYMYMYVYICIHTVLQFFSLDNLYCTNLTVLSPPYSIPVANFLFI